MNLHTLAVRHCFGDSANQLPGWHRWWSRGRQKAAPATVISCPRPVPISWDFTLSVNQTVLEAIWQAIVCQTVWHASIWPKCLFCSNYYSRVHCVFVYPSFSEGSPHQQLTSTLWLASLRVKWWWMDELGNSELTLLQLTTHQPAEKLEPQKFIYVADWVGTLICLDCSQCWRRAKSHTLHKWQFIKMDCKIKTRSSAWTFAGDCLLFFFTLS